MLTHVYLPFKNETHACLSLRPKKSNSIVILISGQSNAAEMYYGLPIYPDESSIIDKIINNGYDVACLDVVGFGRSKGIFTGYYSRETYADQIILAIDYLSSKYTNIFLQGFCSTLPATMIAATKRKVRGIVAQSPLFVGADPTKSHPVDDFLAMRYKLTPLPSVEDFLAVGRGEPPLRFTTEDSFLENRLIPISDSILGYSIRVPHWRQIREQHLKTFSNYVDGAWPSPSAWTYDLRTFPSAFGHQGWKIEDIPCPIAAFRGELDAECLDGSYEPFIEECKSKLVSEIIIPYNTHFGMWDITYDDWANTFVKSLHTLNNA